MAMIYVFTCLYVVSFDLFQFVNFDSLEGSCLDSSISPAFVLN